MNQSWAERAINVIPGGAQTLSKQSASLPANYPKVLNNGVGCYVWDTDGHRYLDFTAGLACIGLGYGEGKVDRDVISTITDMGGVSFSLPHKCEVLVAEHLCKVIPCAEQIRFVKTGSEACAGAVRMARMAYAERNNLHPNYSSRVLVLGYHGWHDWYAVSRVSCPGVPDRLKELTVACPYNDLEALENLFVCAVIEGQRIAVVMLEPVLVEAPKSGYLQGVVDLAHQHGAFVIFDEMVCGFRWALGGGQEYFKVMPDLAVFGKAMANGYPLACITGPKELMHYAWPVSGTFGGEIMSLAACMATIEAYTMDDVIPHLWKMGARLQEGFNQLASDIGVPLVCAGFPVHPVIRGVPTTVASQPTIEILFFQAWVDYGVMMHPKGGNIMYAMKEGDIDFALEQAQKALHDVRRSIEAGGDLETHIIHPRPQPHPLGR